jgi:hypothetical protein
MSQAAVWTVPFLVSDFEAVSKRGKPQKTTNSLSLGISKQEFASFGVFCLFYF